MRLNHINRALSVTNTYYKAWLKVKSISLSGNLLINTDTKKIMSGESTGKGTSLKMVVKKLNEFADLSLAEKWDNVGLLIEPTTEKSIDKILLTNDLTESVMKEAIRKEIDLIISYHPPIFSPLKKITNASWKERIVASCLENRIAVFSPHTSWDAVFGGVNDWLADAFVSNIQPNGKQPLVPSKNTDETLCVATIIGSPESIDSIIKDDIFMKLSERSISWNGKEMFTAICNKEIIKKLATLHNDVNIGILECEKRSNGGQCGMGRLLQVSNLTIADCVHLIKLHTGVSHVRLACAQYETEASTVKTIALVPGSGGSLLKGIQADLFITGEMFHHDVLEANHNGTSVILTNHSDSERGFLVKMASLLKNTFDNNLKIEVSSFDTDPLKTV